MSDNSKICEYYDTGMCIYVSDKFAIFEKCHLEKLSGEFQIKHMQSCIQKRFIEKIKTRELEEKLY